MRQGPTMPLSARRTNLSLRGIDAEAHHRHPAKKRQYVWTLFGIVAPQYDRFTGGLPSGWTQAGNGSYSSACAPGSMTGCVSSTSPVARALGAASAVWAAMIAIDMSPCMIRRVKPRSDLDSVSISFVR